MTFSQLAFKNVSRNNFEYTSIKVSVKDTDADDLYMA